MQETIKRDKTKSIVFLLLAAELAIVFIAVLHMNSVFHSTADGFGHLFKINYLHDSLKNGVIYPIYTPYWYNGMELFRYWPALSYYVTALLQFCTGGDIFGALYLFLGFTYFLNMMGWMLFGKAEKRYGMAFLAGNLFFFCPDNIRVILVEGNLPRIFITALLPWAFGFMWNVLHYRKRSSLIGLGIAIWLITVTHFMMAAMTGITIFVFCVIYSIMNKRCREFLLVTGDLVCAYLTTGIFLIPGLTGGGITSQSSEASVSTISQWAQEAVKSLNPMLRVSSADYRGSFYFGAAIFAIAVFGVIAANKKMGAGFITVVFIFLSTTTVASAVVKLLPMSQVFWMQRFVPMAMCVFFFSLIVWKHLKKSALVIFIIAMLADSVMTGRILTEQTSLSTCEIAEKEMQAYLLPEAAAMTKNRIGFMDFSKWESEPTWYLSRNMDADSVPSSYGWAYQGAKTIDNIVSINEAIENKFYVYAFDRMLEFGDDIILASKKHLQIDDIDAFCQAAEKVGYRLLTENEEAWIFQKEGVEGPFGIKKQYEGLAIGTHAQTICYLYPRFGHGEKDCLDDYSLEELARYEKLYLCGFTYRDKEYAEKLLQQVADKGVKIFVEMQHIPIDKLTGKAEFLDVYSQYVSFTEKFPILSTDNGSQFKLDFRTAGYEVWNTAYISGASESIKKAYYDDATTLTYVARNGHENIIFLGFNPIYYYQENRKPELLTFLNEVLGETPEELAATEIVPIDIEYAKDTVRITSPQDGINSGIANLDCFVPKNGETKKVQNNMLVVDKGTTVFQVKYTDFALGMTVTIIGLAVSIVFYGLFVFRKGGNKHEKNGDDDGMCVGAEHADAGICDNG